MKADRLRRRAVITRIGFETGVFVLLAAVTVQSAIWVKENGAGPSLSAVESAPVAASAPPAHFAAAQVVEPARETAQHEPRTMARGTAAPTMSTRWDRIDPSIMPAPSAKPTPESVREVARAAQEAVTSDGADEAEHIRYYDGRKMRPARTIWMTVTAYSPDWRSCGDSADGITASTKSVWTNGMRMVAADTRVLPMGSLISIPGYVGGEVVPVLDRGGAIKGRRLDVLYPTHEQARQWGVRRLPVVVWEFVDEPAKKR